MTTPQPVEDPALTGPYDPAMGICAKGHPVNAYGRCAAVNDGTESDIIRPTVPPRMDTP